MFCPHLLISILFLNKFLVHGYIIDACRSIKCEKSGEIACLEIHPESQVASYECRCAKECRTLKYIRGPVVRTLPPETNKNISRNNSINGTIELSENPIPIAKLGGSSCYPSACMNGGTCFTNFNPVTTTTTINYNTPLCSCQAQFTGSRCEQYNPVQTTQSWNNLCRVYTDRNMNICQNGGQCVFISDGKVACVCPSNFAGQYCEIPQQIQTQQPQQQQYVQCNSPVSAQCHPSFGSCAGDGSCQCQPGYCGSRCDQVLPNQTLAPFFHPTQAPYFPTQAPFFHPTQAPFFNPTQAGNCNQFCFNGGTCRPSGNNPFVNCLCTPQFTGDRCETFTTPSLVVTTGNPLLSNTTTTSVPRCNFTIGLLNDGLYTARFKVEYTVDGIRQPIITSNSLPFVGQSAYVTLPFYARDIRVTLERLGFSYQPFFTEHLPQTSVQTACTKCYKSWGAVSDPKWDYLRC